MAQLTIRGHDDITESDELDTAKMFSEKISKLQFGWRVRELNLLVDYKLLKKTKTNLVVLGLPNMTDSGFCLCNASCVVLADTRWCCISTAELITRTNTIPYGTEASAAGLCGVRVCCA